VAVLDAPLLLEAGWDELCGALVFVDAPRPLRRQRALTRGWTEEQFESREAAQLSVDEKRRRADFAIDNGGDEEDTREQVRRLWPRLLTPIETEQPANRPIPRTPPYPPSISHR
jgi:dephospho-CoA kinase